VLLGLFFFFLMRTLPPHFKTPLHIKEMAKYLTGSVHPADSVLCRTKIQIRTNYNK